MHAGTYTKKSISLRPKACQTHTSERRTINMGATDDLDRIDDLDWSIRTAIYSFITEQTRPPTVDEAAALLGVTRERAALAYQRLNQRHALFLEPGTPTIRMAHPFSGIPTAFKVRANGRAYFANCAWDMLGIPAALHADAEIDAHYADAANTPVTLSVRGGQVYSHNGGTDDIIHFPLPFQHWYDDLVRT
jgi:Alkylmercury lyase